MIKTLTIAATAILMASAPALATNCYERPVVTPDNASNPVTSLVSAGSSSIGRSHGYTGIPGQNGCPIKAGPGTCVDAGKSLSDASFGGALPVYKTVDLMNGNVPDTEEYRKGILIPPTKWTPEIWIGTQWKPGSCP